MSSRSAGVPLVLSAADVDRWRSHVVVTASHAIWMGAVGSDGYGRFSVSDTASGRERIVTPHQVAAVLALRFPWFRGGFRYAAAGWSSAYRAS